MELKNEHWALLQKRIEKIVDCGYGEMTIKIKDNKLIIKGGETDLIDLCEPVHKSISVNKIGYLTIVKQSAII